MFAASLSSVFSSSGKTDVFPKTGRSMILQEDTSRATERFESGMHSDE
jgi:hypothetical protein